MKPAPIHWILPVLLGLLLPGSGIDTSTGTAQDSQQSGLPSPEKFFGFRMGADRKLATLVAHRVFSSN